MIFVIIDFIIDGKIFMMNFYFIGVFFNKFKVFIKIKNLKIFRHLTGMLVRVYINILTFLVFIISYLIIYGFLD